MLTFMVFHACFITIECRKAAATMKVDINVHMARGTWDNNVWALFFRKINICNALENFN